MAHDIFVEYYELNLATRNKRQIKNKPLPPISNVNVIDAFELLVKHKGSIIGQLYKYQNDDYATALEYIELEKGKNDKKRVDLVISYYDATAPHRTLKNVTDGSENVQERKNYEAVKHLVHCVIREDKNFIAKIGIEKVSGCPASRINKTLDKIFDSLARIAPDAEKVFQITNPDGARNSDGTDDIKSFILRPKIYPMASDELKEAINNGHLMTIELQGQRNTKLDDPKNRLNPTTKSHLSFKPTPIQPNDTVFGYLSSIIETVLKNKQGIIKPKTFAIIENADTGSNQRVEIVTGDELNSVFVLRRKFNPEEGRKLQPDNTKVNPVYLSEIWRKFPKEA